MLFQISSIFQFPLLLHYCESFKHVLSGGGLALCKDTHYMSNMNIKIRVLCFYTLSTLYLYINVTCFSVPSRIHPPTDILVWADPGGVLVCVLHHHVRLLQRQADSRPGRAQNRGSLHQPTAALGE